MSQTWVEVEIDRSFLLDTTCPCSSTVRANSVSRLVPICRIACITAGGAGIAILVVRLVVAMNLLSNVLIAPLEERFQRTEIGDAHTITGVIGLGGSADRFRELGQLARRWPHSRVVASGEPRSTLALLGKGIASQRVLVESRSKNTHENAEFLATLVKPQPGERWLLVTSAVHMPRAMGVFRKNGFAVEPWPIHDGPKDNYDSAVHEWIGLVAYWLRGQTSSLFPAPASITSTVRAAHTGNQPTG